MKFSRAYLLFINVSARLFGVMALLVGIFTFVCAYAFKTNRWMYLVAGILAVAVGVAVFMAKPVTTEDIARIRRKMGGSE
jgi:uncharacterized membrane protein HdeD (DUF308 family)